MFILIDKMIKNLINLFFPKICLGCKNLLTDNEVNICTKCRNTLPVTDYHNFEGNAMEKIFYGRSEINAATALLRYSKKGIVQELMHNLKYRGHEEIGNLFGSWLGYELSQSERFQNIDIVIPVPLHKSKLKKRGYNQVSKFAQELAKFLNTSCNETILLKSQNTKTQVFKKRFARWQRNNEIFTIKNGHLLANKNVLIADDIVTTGATLEKCCEIIKPFKPASISIACIAITD